MAKILNVSYQVLTPQLVPKAVDCIGVSFATKQDPFTHALKLTSQNWSQMAALFVERAALKDLSFVAVGPDGKLLGVIVNEDWKEKKPGNYSEFEGWAPVRAMFNELHTRFKAQQPFIEQGKVLHPLYFTCVLPEARKQGIVKGLWSASVELARNRNYERMVAEASNPESAAVFHKLGFTEKCSVSYADFMFHGKKPFAKLVKHGYQSLALFEKHIPSNLY